MELTATRKVLIVDDDPLVCWAIGRELAVRRLNLQNAGTGKACIAGIGREAYDIVFLDAHLPDAGGIDLLRVIRKTSPATRVVLLSGDGNRKDQEAAIAEGAVQYLEKPFDPSLASRIVNALFGDYSEHRRAPRYFCSMRLWIHLRADPPGEGKALCGKAEEIGPRGIRISTVIPLEPGRTVWLRPVDPDRPFSGYLPSGAAEVEWVQARPPEYVAGLLYLTPAGTSGPGTGASRS